MLKLLISRMARPAFALGLLVATLSVANAAKPNFSDFEGKYNGTWVITASGTSYATTVTADVSVDKSGAKMTLPLSGILTVSGQTVAIQTSMKFDSKRKIKSDAVLMGFAGPAATLPARFSGAKKNFAFTLSAVPGATLISFPITGTTMNYTLKFAKKSLSIVGTGTLVQSGSPTPLQIFINLRKKGKK